MRVFINNNVNIELGMFNGKQGTLRCLIYAEGVYPPQLPLAAIVELDDCVVPKALCFNKWRNCVVIEPMTVPANGDWGS